ncbi:unnamed protein product [Mytilus coruscus]|uniref:Ig-like domain-containing protein n=1 Tax=Mytilus coruscus TaxID=42192 RepID=A0A6J8ANC9_MYTCO|nr:unnamed protein product [Mytilus coruscus]
MVPYFQDLSLVLKIVWICVAVSKGTDKILTKRIMCGETAVLPCQNIPGNKVIQWLRLNPSKNVTENTYTDGQTVNTDLPFHRRISINISPEEKYDLNIINVSKEDEGTYRCAFIQDARVKSQDVRLFVQEQDDNQPVKLRICGNSTCSYIVPAKSQLSFTITALFGLSGTIGGCLILIAASVLLRILFRYEATSRDTGLTIASADAFWSSPTLPSDTYVFDNDLTIQTHQENVQDMGNELLHNIQTNMNNITKNGTTSRDQLEHSSNQNLSDDMNTMSNRYEENHDPRLQSDIPHVYDECGVVISSMANNTYQSLTRNWKDTPHLYQ